jgi:hypothetical protein
MSGFVVSPFSLSISCSNLSICFCCQASTSNSTSAFILYQYHHQHVTQPLLLEQIRDLGVDISSGKLSHILTEDLDDFHAEKELPDTVRLFGDRVQFISLQVMVNRPKLFSCLTDRLDVIII